MERFDEKKIPWAEDYNLKAITSQPLEPTW